MKTLVHEHAHHDHHLRHAHHHSPAHGNLGLHIGVVVIFAAATLGLVVMLRRAARRVHREKERAFLRERLSVDEKKLLDLE